MRYLGTKTELVDKIYELIKDKKIDNENFTFCDAFSGTGAVGESLKDKFRIIANDVQYYSFIISQAKLNTPDLKFLKLGFDPFVYFNSEGRKLEGFIYKNYSDKGSERMYFSAENGLKIDFIRNKIDEWKKQDKLTDFEYYYLIAALLESVSKVANIAGVYGSYLKTWDPRAIKPMQFIKVEQRDIRGLYEAEVHNKTIEQLINDISGDILYLDPPYTSTQYAGQYHLLETISKNDDPQIFGKGGLRNTAETTSDWSRRGEAEVAFEKIVAKAKFKYIILSYSPDGLMSEKYIENVLKRYGKPETYELRKLPYKKYINYHSKKDASRHCEFLFFIEKKDYEKVNYASPLNYQGGKYDLLDFIQENLPDENIKRFVDAFGGGYNVGINIEAEQVIYNEFNHKVVELMQCFKDTEIKDLTKYLLRSIKRYKLDKGDKEAYIRLRERYNSTTESHRDPKMLYLILLYGFRQQLRFNSSYEFNNPVGNSSFNEPTFEKLVSFCRRLQEQNILFLAYDFEKLSEYIDRDTFVYCDPPYLITLGSYNDGKRGFNGWDASDEVRLYNFLDNLNARGVKFMMSNVLEHKGLQNSLLADWVKDRGYNILNNTGVGGRGRKEILITNYQKSIL